MDVTRVLAIRHGETAWNADGRIQGHRDIALNERGREQARALATALADETIGGVYASDLQRAIETAHAFAKPAGWAINIDVSLRERHFGAFEGLTFAEVEQRWPEAALRWRQRDPGYAVGGGETLLDFRARCVAALTRLAAAHMGQTIAIVAHGGVLDMWYRAACGMDLESPRTWPMHNASVNRLLYTGEGFSLVGWGDVSHLQPLQPG